MLLKHDKYKNFRRSTKLLLHAKDIPHFQFTSETEGSGEIPTEAEISVIETTFSLDNQNTVSCCDLTKKSGEMVSEWVVAKSRNICKRSNY